MVKTSKKSKKFAAKTARNSSQQNNHKGKVIGKKMVERKTREERKLSSKKSRPGNSRTHQPRETHTQTRKGLDNQIQSKDIDLLGEENLGDLNLEDFLSALTKDEDWGLEMEDENEKEEDEPRDDKKKPVIANASLNEDSEDSDNLDQDESEDEDITKAEQRMRDEMRKLGEKDPDFHRYLRENESSLLDFDSDEDNDDEMSIGGDHVEMDQNDVNDETAGLESLADDNKEIHDESRRVHLTAKLLSSYEQGAFRDHGIKSLKKLVSAYKSACKLSDSQLSDDERGKSKYIDFDSPLISNRVIVQCLQKFHTEFSYHLFAKNNTQKDDADNIIDPNVPINPRVLSKAPRWFDIQPIVNSFIKATIQWLSEVKNPSLITFVLKSLSNYIPYLSDFPRLASICLKRLTLLWSDSDDASIEYQFVRLNAFLRIRQLSITQPFPFIESCLKSCYLAYAKRAKFANAATVSTLLPTITFMGNCCVELYSLDYASSYQHAFIYIRQLALHLRNALQKRTPESFSVVYCWQYMHCLKMWVAVLSAACQASNEKDDDSHLMRSLIYPLVEVILGTARLIPNVRFLPLRFHCVRLLQQLAASAELYIPTSSLLLEVLDIKEIYLKPKSVNSRGKDVRGVRIAVLLKLPKVDTMRTVEQLDSCLGELFTLLHRELDLYRFSPGFPEFTLMITQRLRKFSKAINNGKYRAYSRGCIDLCEKLAQAAVKARSHLTIAPKDVTHFEILKPKDQPSMYHRYESSVAKENRFDFGSVSLQMMSSAAPTMDENRSDEVVETFDCHKMTTNIDSKVSSKESIKTKASQKKIDHDRLDEDDEVHDGFSWSDEDKEQDDDDDDDIHGSENGEDYD